MHSDLLVDPSRDSPLNMVLGLRTQKLLEFNGGKKKYLLVLCVTFSATDAFFLKAWLTAAAYFIVFPQHTRNYVLTSMERLRP